MLEVYDYIVNPDTGRRVSVHSSKGKRILRDYVYYYNQQAGAEADESTKTDESTDSDSTSEQTESGVSESETEVAPPKFPEPPKDQTDIWGVTQDMFDNVDATNQTEVESRRVWLDALPDKITAPKPECNMVKSGKEPQPDCKNSENLPYWEPPTMEQCEDGSLVLDGERKRCQLVNRLFDRKHPDFLNFFQRFYAYDNSNREASKKQVKKAAQAEPGKYAEPPVWSRTKRGSCSGKVKSGSGNTKVIENRIKLGALSSSSDPVLGNKQLVNNYGMCPPMEKCVYATQPDGTPLRLNRTVGNNRTSRCMSISDTDDRPTETATVAVSTTTTSHDGKFTSR